MKWVKFVALLSIGCSQGPAPSRWSQVENFACQLQDLNLEQASASPFQLLITDPTRDGNSAYSPAEVQQLHSGGRLLLGYLSVGEAESYRPYWQKQWKPGAPAWLGPKNPEWGGNYKVCYWEPAWRQIVLANARQIQDQGFDGLFLDVVDGWEYWQPRVPTARAAMIDLIQELARETRTRQPDFGIVLNGGEGLPELLETITGVAKEEIHFGLGGDGKATPPEFTRNCQSQLAPLVQAGKLVLSIDYTHDPAQKKQAQERARQSGYLEFIGERDLDSLPHQ